MPSQASARANTTLGLLAAVGVLCLALYLLAFTQPYYLPRTYAIVPPVDVGKLTDYSTEAGATYFGAVFALFLGYLFAWLGLRRVDIGRRGLVVILGFGLLFSAALMLVYPITAIDLFGYVARGRVLGIHHANPFLHPPSDFPDDPTGPYAGGWISLASPYGPAWEWLAAAAAVLGGEDFLRSLLVFKGVVVLAYALDALLIWAILSRLNPQQRLGGTLLFAWNPLVLLETAANGHNDVVMLLPVLLAVWLLADHRLSATTALRGALALAALTLAAWVKYIPLLLGLPALIAIWRALPTWRARWGALLGGAVLSGAITAALWFPLWPGLDRLMVVEEAGRILFSPAALAVQVLAKQGWDGARAANLVGPIALTTFGIVYLIILARTERGAPGFATGGLAALWAYLLIGGLSFRHWYPLWLLPLAALVPKPVLVAGALVFSLTGELSPAYYTFGWVWWGPSIGWDGLAAIGIPIVFGLPVAVGLIAWAWQGWEGR
jgi:alpha-1,6-mannosyltransferase